MANQNINNTIINIELLYVYISDFKNLNKIQINFTGLGSYKIEENSNILKLYYQENRKYPKSIFPINMHTSNVKLINNVTAIIGQNGAGKSNILEYLKRILSNELLFNEDSIIIFKINNEVKLYHSFEKSIELQGKLDIEIVRSIEADSFFIRTQILKNDLSKRFEKLSLPFLSSSRVVFYSPLADFQNFPFHDNDPPYNDISTNYLLEYDQGKGEEFSKTKFDKNLSHKSQTTRRFIDLIYSGLPLPEEISKFIPNETYIQINRLNDPTYNSKNLNPDDELFLKQFTKKVHESWNMAYQLKEIGNEIEYQRLKFKTEFSYSLILHFFHNKEDEFEADSMLDGSEIDWGWSMGDIVRFYFEYQKWKPNSIYLLLYNSIISAIESSVKFSELSTESFSFSVDMSVDLITLYSNYLNYENLFIDTYHPSGLLDFYWRGISSGEKTLLDLFARLLHTKKVRFVNAGASELGRTSAINNIFLLIDEGEIGFHPQWQKNYLKYLIDFLKYTYCDYNVQLFLTSHSPFLISDLPRENVVFIGKNGQNSKLFDPKNLNLTFGGNIHEMLIDSFFLTEGIIGAFSQEIINNLISEILSDNAIKADRIIELKHIIETIGETVVRTKLLNMLSEKKTRDNI